MINVNKADKMIEELELLAEDNYYPLESNDKYDKIVDIVETAGFNGESFVDKDEFLPLYISLKKAINNW